MTGNFSLRRRVGLAAAVAGAFTLLFTVLVFTYSFPGSTPELLKVFIVYHFEFMIAMVGLGVLAGAAILYLMGEEVKHQHEESKLNAELALSLLHSDERKAVKLLLEKGGSAGQAEVARVDGMTRLKAHRTAKSLSARGLVSLERNGKAVTLKLAESVRQALAK